MKSKDDFKTKKDYIDYLRMYFAAAAMTGVLPNNTQLPMIVNGYNSSVSAWCIDKANLLISELERQGYLGEKEPDVMNLSIDELDVSIRVINCLKIENLLTIGDIVNYRYGECYNAKQSLAKIPNIGKKAVNQLIDALKTFDVELS